MKRQFKILFLTLFFTFIILPLVLDVGDVTEKTYDRKLVATYFESKSNKRSLTNLAIFIEFSDSDANVLHHLDDAQSVENAYKIYNSDALFEMDSVNGIIKVPSFKKYYEKESYGQLSITTEIFPKVNGKVVSYQDPHPIGYYLNYNEKNPIGYKNKSEASEREKELIQNAVAYVKDEVEASKITAGQLDTDGDGAIDAITFIVEGQKNLPASVAWGELLWSHESSNTGITESIFGKSINAYTLIYADDYTETAGLFSLNRGNYGTIIHEFGHVLGYKDLYRYGDSNAKPVGFYDIMGNVIGSNPQSFLTYFISEFHPTLAWHNPLPIIQETTENITLYKPNYLDPNEKRAIKIQMGGNQEEYFIVEYHEKRNTYESHSADESGIIVYRVNEKNKYMGNGDGSNQGRNEHIYVFRPGETGLGAGLGNLSTATLNMRRPILGKEMDFNHNTFDPQSIYFSDGSNSGIQIQVISETPDTVTFDVIFPEFEGDGTKDNPYLIDQPNVFLHLMSLSTKNKYYKLTTNLDFKEVSNYPVIYFEGNLDGNYKTISNLKTNNSGVFHTIGNFSTPTKIENLVFENITVYAKKGDYLGGFASVAENVTLTNIHLKSGTVTNEGSSLNSLVSTGGFLGNAGNGIVIENCSSSLNVTANTNVGGFIGINLNAKIKNSFAAGHVTGNKNIGGFIGLQAISDSIYHVPQNVYFNNTNQNLPGAGGYASIFHNLTTLDSNSLSKGIISISSLNNIEMGVNTKKSLPITTTPNTNLIYNVSIAHPDILKYENNQIIALKVGTTDLYIDIIIGTEKMRLVSNVIVTKSEEVITEEEVLRNLGLMKKGDYVNGFTLGLNVKDFKKMISNGVILKSFKNAAGIEINEGTVATGMKFTLYFNHKEYHYTIVIKGDVNGDGLIYATDYVKVKNHIMGKTSLNGAYLLAADINNDGNIYATDYVQIKNHIMGKNVIKQK